MRMKYLSLIAAVALVAACETAPQDSGAATGTGGAQTSQVRPGSQEDLVVNVGDRVFFGFDRYDLSPEARATLDRQTQWLNTYPSVTVTVEGHADERGTREYNLALGERRANSVKNYMVAKGINPSRVKTISYGKERPAVLGSNEAAWAQNRRGVTVVD
ncbi:peptidoglycan-associated lipoprotein Pal [Azospirillum sp. A39]|uniref:peptidoglycan-associated lipoprotein Pal n=1 Tax=Azospirillum sp. A39 TaxID=3462279 RepID=UPI004045EB57